MSWETEGSWRERFREDFGIDLPISGGGGGRESHVIVTANTPQHAVDVQAAFLRCLGRGQRVAWRYISQELRSEPVRSARVQIERVELTDREVITEHVSYYFTWEGPAAESASSIPPVPSGYLDPRSGLMLPYELGWLHLDSVTDNEPDQYGLGVTVAYGGFGCRATVYLYDGGQHVDSADQDRLEAEFKRAVGDAVQVVDGASIRGAWRVPGDAGKEGWRLAILDLPDGQLSAVILGAARGVFVKGRVTWQANEEKLHDIGHECVRAIMERIGPAKVWTT